MKTSRINSFRYSNNFRLRLSIVLHQILIEELLLMNIIKDFFYNKHFIFQLKKSNEDGK
jgi:hypothetical protein